MQSGVFPIWTNLIEKEVQASVRCPVISGRLFQTRRGRQIVQDSLDESASSDNETISSMAMKVRVKKTYEEKEDSKPRRRRGTGSPFCHQIGEQREDPHHLLGVSDQQGTLSQCQFLQSNA